MSDNDINDYPLPSLQKHSSSHGAHTETQPRSAAGVKSAQDNASVAQSKVKLEAEIEELERRIEKNEPVEADVEDVRYECVITLWLFYALCLRTLTALPPPLPHRFAICPTRRRRGLFQKNISEPLKRFIADSTQFLTDCERPAFIPTAEGSKSQVPDFLLIAGVTGTGFIAFGVIAFAVKVIHAPITQILLG